MTIAWNTIGITSPQGFLAAGGTFGIKTSGRPDMTLIVCETLASAAGVFTTNQMTSAPVDVDRKHLRLSHGTARAVIVNSGNANASTGAPGLRDAWTMCKLTAQAIHAQPAEVLVSSTGIIGRPLPMDKIARGIQTLATQVDRGSLCDLAAATGILTTDLIAKSAGLKVKIGGKAVTVAGIAKGSGMISPNMATLLAFVTTDAAISPAMLGKALKAAAAASFNRISVDQHTSPSDTLICLASALAGHAKITSRGKAFDGFVQALTEVCKSLAYQVVKDGEGATKVYRVIVKGAANEKDADKVGRAIVDSPLVKCAVHGSDPNWGRITTAAGYAGAKVVAEKMSLSIGQARGGKGVCVFKKGQPTDVGRAPDAALKAIMKEKEITFTLDLGVGKATAQWLGCDLSRQYIRINADYTT